MPTPFGLVVRFRLRPGAADAFDRLTADTLRQIRAHEPGTLVYAAHTVHGEPDQRVLYELYTDRTAFEQHERQPHVRHFLSARDQHLEGFDVQFLTPTHTKGLPADTAP